MRLSIPITTLPNISQLLSSIFTQQSSGNLWRFPKQKSIFFHRSAWGISEVVKALLLLREKPTGTVFLPDYFCNQALIPLRLQPVQLVFYPVTEKLNPDWSLIDDLVLQFGNPDLFILVHYFGFSGEITKAIRFCQRVGAELLEDGAHVLKPFGEIGKHSWAAVFSPYKLLPVPKIGILIVSEKIGIVREKPGKREWFDADIYKWIVKRLLQSFLISGKIPWRSGKAVPFELDEEVAFEEDMPVNTWVLQMLKILESQLEYYKAIRRDYYRIIEEQILAINSSIVNPFFSSLPDDVCPYLFPIHIHEDKIKHIYYNLNRIGVPAQSWPDLPPEVKEKPFQHKIALKLRRSILTLPVHQSLTKSQVEFMASSLRKIILSADFVD